MNQLAWDDSRSSNEASPVPPQHPSPPRSSQAQVAPVPPEHRAKPGCEHTQGELPSLPPRGKADCQTFAFCIITCTPLKWFAYHWRYTHPARGPPRQDQTFYSCQEQACCRKREKRQKISCSCFTLGFEAVKGESVEKEKAVGKTRTEPSPSGSSLSLDASRNAACFGAASAVRV